LAIFTLLPVLLSLKLPGVGIHLSPAALVYLVYHFIGIYVWASVRQLSILENTPEVKRRVLTQCVKLHKVASWLAWLVGALLVLTFLAKLQIVFFGSHIIPIPEWAKQIVGVT
jgi:hypothetical protein